LAFAAGAEISAYDPGTRRTFGINGAMLRVDVLDISDPTAPALAFTVPLIALPNGVAARDGVVAVAVENPVRTRLRIYGPGRRAPRTSSRSTSPCPTTPGRPAHSKCPRTWGA